MIFKVTTFFVVVGLFIFGLTWFSRRESFQFTAVSVEGNANVDNLDIKNVAELHLAGSYLKLFPHSNKFIYPKKSIESDIMSAFPQIASASVAANGQNVLISVTERKPAYLWCKSEPEDANLGTCYFMDTTGFIFSEAPHFSGDAYFIYRGPVLNENPIGVPFMNPKSFNDLNAFQTLVREAGIQTNTCVAHANGVREFYLRQGGKIIFKSSQKATDLVLLLKLIKEETKLFSSQATTTLEYIDLRFGNKVYYKFVGDNPIQSNQ